MLFLRLIIREFRGSKRLTWLFILNLTIGLIGFIVLDGFKRDFNRILSEASRTMLTADLRVSARRALSSEEVAKLQKALPASAEITKVISLYSMIAVGADSHLVQVRAINQGFPFYGHLLLAQNGKITTNFPEGFFGEPLAIIADSLAQQLELAIGDVFKLGALEYRIADVLLDESAVSWGGATLAPRIYVSQESLAKTDLVRKGTVAWYSSLLKVADLDRQGIEALATKLEAVLPDPAINIKTYLTSGQDNGRMLRYLNDYLGLVALTALALAGLGAGYLFQSYLLGKRKDIGILLSLGMTHNRALLFYSGKLAVWGMIATVLSCILGALILPFSADVIAQLTPLAFAPRLGLSSILLTFVLGTGYSLLICLPLLMQIRTLKAGGLFQEQIDSGFKVHWSNILFLLPALGGFYLLAVWQANSWYVGSLFCLLLVSALLGLFGIGILLIRLTRLLQPTSIVLKICLRYLQRMRVQAIMSFISIAIGSLLINLIPQLQLVLNEELAAPKGIDMPSLFMFDIQEEQVMDLGKAVASRSSLRTSAMIRARLLEVNDVAVERDAGDMPATREAEQSRRMRNRGVNLSYRDSLAPSEKIVSGRDTVKDFVAGSIPEITVEYRYAERMNLELGDTLTFAVQGIPIKGKIVGLRKVKWNSFDPNFFIQFQPGVLEDAPKTFVAAIANLPDQDKVGLQRQIVREFPNISIIDVSKVIEKIMSIASKMTMILMLMALLTVAAGFIVLFSIASHQARQRRGDLNLLKILGLSITRISFAIQLEFLLVAGSGALLGSLASVLAGYIVTKEVFEGDYSWHLSQPILLVAAVTVICVFVARSATARILKAKPSFYLDS